jgi:hypothetical protein
MLLSVEYSATINLIQADIFEFAPAWVNHKPSAINLDGYTRNKDNSQIHGKERMIIAMSFTVDGDQRGIILPSNQRS